MRNGDTLICKECERLWSNYQRATQQHQHLLSRLKTESSSAGKTEAAMRIRQVNDADLARKHARDALETHQLHSGHR